ncbi:chromate transporter [Cytobacillus sp. Hz8]|uniref:chromate transporter n=1 Tax=Cytobacillus sp. Hz8 TaxID=3347168 RepID=UPI0035DD8E8C
MKHRTIFIAFFRSGMLGYGGGPSAIPLIHREVVERYQWFDDKEFADTLALANTLPGPIATKMAGYIGYRIKGIGGMLNAIIATVIPTVILMIILLTTLSSFKHMSWVAGMTKAVVPVVCVMLGVMTWDFLKMANKELGWLKNIIIVVFSIVAIEVFSIHPAIIIIVLMSLAWLPKLHDKNKLGVKK